jgi:hypothetical protein
MSSVPDRPDLASAGAAVQRARRLDAAARITVEKATALVNAAQGLRRQRELWRHIWIGLENDVDRVVACCSYCGRVRTGEGEWGAIPVEVVHALYGSSAVMLTHGICPDCEASLTPELVSARCGEE